MRRSSRCRPANDSRCVIARALSHHVKVLILDEPTSSLSARETERLLMSVRRLARSAVAVLFVSHDLLEIEEVSDRVVVLRDGVVTRVLSRPFRARELVHAMLGTVAPSLEHEARRERVSSWLPVACGRGRRAHPSTSTSGWARSSGSPAWSERARPSSWSSSSAPGRWSAGS